MSGFCNDNMCVPVCDFCTFYTLASDNHSQDVQGYCEHPRHPLQKQPDESCDDFRCVFKSKYDRECAGNNWDWVDQAGGFKMNNKESLYEFQLEYITYRESDDPEALLKEKSPVSLQGFVQATNIPEAVALAIADTDSMYDPDIMIYPVEAKVWYRYSLSGGEE